MGLLESSSSVEATNGFPGGALVDPSAAGVSLAPLGALLPRHTCSRRVTRLALRCSQEGVAAQRPRSALPPHPLCVVESSLG